MNRLGRTGSKPKDSAEDGRRFISPFERKSLRLSIGDDICREELAVSLLVLSQPLHFDQCCSLATTQKWLLFNVCLPLSVCASGGLLIVLLLSTSCFEAVALSVWVAFTLCALDTMGKIRKFKTSFLLVP